MHDARAAASGEVAARLSGTGRTPGAPHYQPLLHAYTVGLAACILLLICSGGMVTSKNAGLAVPDWPNSYGYNMFTFPVSRWVGGVFFEHTHRLLASFIGLLTSGLAAWVALTDERPWMKKLGFAALGAVILQGLLGGLRVTQLADWIGIFHACLAQAFFAVVAFIAFAQSRWWLRLAREGAAAGAWQRTRGLRRHVLAMALVIFTQLTLGATMRHAHAGLAITDFPKAYGHWWPQVHKADLPAVNEQRASAVPAMPPTSLAQIHLQMMHRLMAAVIALGVIAAAVSAWRKGGLLPGSIRRFAWGWPVLIAAQVTLGMYVIWTGKSADVATAHVAVGALSLVWGVVFYAALRRWSEPARTRLVPMAARELTEVPA